MGHWNHRVVRREFPEATPDDRVLYAIHEAYYEPGERKVPWAVAVDPTPVIGQSVEQLRETLQRMLRALDTPVLDYETRQELPADPTAAPTEVP